MKKKFKFVIPVGIAALLLIAIYNPRQVQQNISPSTEEEKFLLNPPPKEASKSAKVKHAQTVAKLANGSSSLEIKDCKPNPLVLKVKQGSEFQIINQDHESRRIIVDGKHYYDIPANSSQTIKVEFKYGTGDYGYVCEGVGIVGFIHVV